MFPDTWETDSEMQAGGIVEAVSDVKDGNVRFLRVKVINVVDQIQVHLKAKFTVIVTKLSEVHVSLVRPRIA
jgi:hypothetical protein